MTDRDRHGADGDAGLPAHGGEPVLHLFHRDGVHRQIAEHWKDVLAHDAGVDFPGPGFPAMRLPVEEFLGEGGPWVPWRTGTVVDIHRFDEIDDEPAASRRA